MKKNLTQEIILILLNINQSKFIFYKFRNNNVVTVGVINKSDVPQKIVLDFSKDSYLKLSSKKTQIEKVKNILIFSW